MSARSNIEWTDASWTPIRARNIKTGKVGWHCEHATTGCEFCYAEGMNKRLGSGLPFKPGHRKDVEIFLDEEMLLAPLRWKKPRMIFVCSMTDLFAEFVTDEWIDLVFAVMALAPQHTFQVLTKRAERMRDYFAQRSGNVSPTGFRCPRINHILNHADRISRHDFPAAFGQLAAKVSSIVDNSYFPNVWLGVSTERQQEADERIPLLLQTPAALRFISAEPLLGPISLGKLPAIALGGQLRALPPVVHRDGQGPHVGPHLDWVIAGGESGSDARPMHPGWARDLRDDCEAAGVAFFFKQWGEWHPQRGDGQDIAEHCLAINGAISRGDELRGGPEHRPRWIAMERVGKKAAGRHLDGVLHDAMPQTGRGMA